MSNADRALLMVQGAISDLPVAEAMAVLAKGMLDLVAGAADEKPVATAPTLLRLLDGRVSSIEKDSEVEAFLLNARGYPSIVHIHRACVMEFGVARAPSRTALYRYVNKMRKRCGMVKDED